jgi:hypothetical protein
MISSFLEGNDGFDTSASMLAHFFDITNHKFSFFNDMAWNETEYNESWANAKANECMNICTEFCRSRVSRNSTSSTPEPVRSCSEPNHDYDMPKDRASKKAKRRKNFTEDELDLYLEKIDEEQTRCNFNAEFNPVSYWLSNTGQYPTLFPIAMNNLNVCLSSSSVERKFSRSKNIANPLRNRLNDESLALSVFLIREY